MNICFFNVVMMTCSPLFKLWDRLTEDTTCFDDECCLTTHDATCLNTKSIQEMV